jgi:hypothetical protein
VLGGERIDSARGTRLAHRRALALPGKDDQQKHASGCRAAARRA